MCKFVFTITINQHSDTRTGTRVNVNAALELELISYRYSEVSTHHLVVVGATPSKKAPRSIISNGIWMKFGTIVPQVNIHRFTEFDFQFNVII